MRIENKIIIFEGVEDIKGARLYAKSGEFIIRDFIENPLNYNHRAIVARGVIPIIGGSLCMVCICNNNIPHVLMNPDPIVILDWIKANPNYGPEVSEMVARDLYEALEKQLMMKVKEVIPAFSAPIPTSNSTDLIYHYDRDALNFLKTWLGSKDEFVFIMKSIVRNIAAILARSKETKSGHTEYVAIFKLGASVDLELIPMVTITAFNPQSLHKAVNSSTEIPKHAIEAFNEQFTKYINL